MSKVNKKLKIAIIGPYPPPFGGISIHIQRMHQLLQEKMIEHTIYTGTDVEENNIVNITGKKWLLKYVFVAKENIFHFHSIDWGERVAIGLMGFLGKKVILTIHGQSLNEQINQSGWLRKKTLIWALKNISSIITVNKKILELLTSFGVKPKRITHIPAFIPPIIKDEEAIEIPLDIWNFIDRHTPVISANAFRITFYNGQDLYGIDLCIDLCATLKKCYPKIGVIFCLPNIGNYEYFDKMKQRIKEEELGGSFVFQTKPCQLYPVIRRSDLFVRPTNMDGYGVSVAEAVYFKVPTVASDVCRRAEGAILFKNRDINDFVSKVKNVLDNYEYYKKRLEAVNLEDNFEKIMKVYQTLRQMS